MIRRAGSGLTPLTMCSTANPLLRVHCTALCIGHSGINETHSSVSAA